jgi:HD-GYP domain-containing protein (c-di-GMP phosphodiesterase class II)
LKKKQIHIGARIMAVADAYDAMTSDRPYRRAFDQEKALAELRKGTGTQFDPRCVEAFMEFLRKKEARCQFDKGNR